MLVLKFRVAQKFVTYVLTTALVERIGSYDEAKKLNPTVSVASLSNSFVSHFIVMPKTAKWKIYGSGFSRKDKQRYLLKIGLEKNIVSNQAMIERFHRSRTQISQAIFLFRLIKLRPNGINGGNFSIGNG